MAKIARYYEDNSEELYSEGPYVLTSGLSGRFRIDKRGNTCPIMPPLWVYDLREILNIPKSWQPFDVLAPLVDTLNWAHLFCESLKR